MYTPIQTHTQGNDTLCTLTIATVIQAYSVSALCHSKFSLFFPLVVADDNKAVIDTFWNFFFF